MSITLPSDMPAAAPAEIAYRELPLDCIFASPLNPRRHMREDSLAELAASIAAKGLLQPILVRPARQRDCAGPAEGTYEIIHGARRYAAARAARADGTLPADWRIPARVRDCNDDELVVLAGVENFDREDMAPLDEAELFAAVRPRVTPGALPDGTTETREAALARLFHIGARTVFRRLALLRCAPEVQQALRAGQITLGQANALSLGAPERQRELLPAATGPDSYGNRLSPEDIRYDIIEIAEGPLAWDAAIFDPADYHSAVIEDAESGDKWFADRGEFMRLQQLAVAAKATDIEATWPWVDIIHGSYLTSAAYRDWSVAAADPDAGAVILVRDGGERVTVEAPVLRMATARAREAADRPDHRATGPADAAQATTRLPLSAAQIDKLHEAKTQALRRAIVARVTHDGRVPKALACLGLLGASEVSMSRSPAAAPIESASPERRQVSTLVKALSAELSRAHQPARLDYRAEMSRVLGGTYPGGARDAAWFGALMALPAAALDDLFAALVAERAASWVLRPDPSGQKPALIGDSPLAVAIATYTAAETELPSLWHPDAEWFLGYSRDRLVAIVRDQLRVKNAEKMKKAELAALCAEQPKGFWRPSHFPECTFQTEAEALAALAAEPPAAPQPCPARRPARNREAGS